MPQNTLTGDKNSNEGRLDHEDHNPEYGGPQPGSNWRDDYAQAQDTIYLLAADSYRRGADITEYSKSERDEIALAHLEAFRSLNFDPHDLASRWSASHEIAQQLFKPIYRAVDLREAREQLNLSPKLVAQLNDQNISEVLVPDNSPHAEKIDYSKVEEILISAPHRQHPGSWLFPRARARHASVAVTNRGTPATPANRFPAAKTPFPNDKHVCQQRPNSWTLQMSYDYPLGVSETRMNSLPPMESSTICLTCGHRRPVLRVSHLFRRIGYIIRSCQTERVRPF